MLANDWAPNDARFLFHPAMKRADPRYRLRGVHGVPAGTDRKLIPRSTGVRHHHAGRQCHCAQTDSRRCRGGAGVRPAKTLDDYFASRIAEKRASESTDMFSVLCHATDEEGAASPTP